MVNETELKQAIEFIQEFRTNVARSLNIRLKISRQRIYATRLLEQNHQDQNGIRLLRRCLYRERSFLKIIKKGLENSYEKLEAYSAWIKIIVKDKELKNNSVRLLEIVEIFDSKLDNINKRLELEEYFIENRDRDSYEKFLRQWKKEVKLNRKLLKKVADADDLESYFKKIKMTFGEDRVGNLVTLGITAASLKLLDMFIYNPRSNAAIFTGLLTVIFNLAIIMSMLKKTEEDIEFQNLEELENAIKVEKESRRR